MLKKSTSAHDGFVGHAEDVVHHGAVAVAVKDAAELAADARLPAALLAAHQLLDKKVDECYGLKTPFSSEAKRVAWLFERYEELVGGGREKVRVVFRLWSQKNGSHFLQKIRSG